MGINRLFFHVCFASQQIDLEQYSKPYWQPKKGTQEWNTASKWRKLCHNVGQLISNALKPCEVNVGDVIQKRLVIINQSVNQTSIASISPAKPGSVARQPNQCSTAKSRKQFISQEQGAEHMCNTHLFAQVTFLLFSLCLRISPYIENLSEFG